MSERNEEDILRVAEFLESGDDSWDDQNPKQADNKERYQKKRFIAAGGMKEIYEVYDEKMCRSIAMAQLKKDGPLWHCEAFLKEAYLTASLEHPNIISVYDVGVTDEDEPYFLMELKVGLQLTDIAGRTADLNERLLIFVKVCDAVSYAHSIGVLHLDIKPDNIQVGEHGEVKLCDWGLACKVDEEEQDSVFIKGTPGFMSPEQASKGKLSRQTDIYSLGALLYFLLTDTAPFEGGLNTKISNTAEGEFVSPIVKFPDLNVPGSLDAVVRRSMSVDPDSRYKSVDELKADVNKYLSGHSTKAENAGFLKECLLFYRRNRQSCLVAFAFLIILTLTISVSVSNLNKSKNRIEETLDDLKKTHMHLKKAQQKEQQAFARSEKNYQKYIEQKEEQMRANNLLKVKSLDAAYSAMLYPVFFFDPVDSVQNSLQILETHITKNDDSFAEQQIIINLFISQQFDLIRNYKPTYTKPLAELARKFADFQKNKKGTLHLIEFTELLQGLNSFEYENKDLRDAVIERMVYYYLAKKKESFINQRIMVELIRSMNPDWNPENIDYKEELNKLVITGKELRQISGNREYNSKKCILSLMNMDTLVLKNTGISKSYQFAGLNLQKLDVRETAVDSLNPFSAFRGISVLHVIKGQLKKEFLTKKPKFLKIVIH